MGNAADMVNLDLRFKQKEKEIRDQYDRIQGAASSFEEYGVKKNMTVGEMDQAWQSYQQRQQQVIVQQKVQKTTVPEIDIQHRPANQ